MLTVSKDGTRVPGSIRGERHFKGDGGRRSRLKRVQTLMDNVCSVLGRFCLSVRVSRVSAGRARLTGGGLGRLGHVGVGRPVLIVFSEKCPSVRFISFLRARGVGCLFHLSSGSCGFRHDGVMSASRTIVLQRARRQLRGVEGERPSHFRRVGRGMDARAQVVASVLPSKGRLTLVAGLPFRVSRGRLRSLCCRE